MDNRWAADTRVTPNGGSEQRLPRSETSRNARSGPARILVVDDSTDALTILRLFLSSEGYQVITAETVTEALQHVRECLPDLVMTDYLMPERTGLELCRELRAGARTRHIPIVLHTASELSATRSPLYEAVCEKPASLAQISRAVRALLPGAQARSQLHH